MLLLLALLTTQQIPINWSWHLDLDDSPQEILPGLIVCDNTRRIGKFWQHFRGNAEPVLGTGMATRFFAVSAESLMVNLGELWHSAQTREIETAKEIVPWSWDRVYVLWWTSSKGVFSFSISISSYKTVAELQILAI